MRNEYRPVWNRPGVIEIELSRIFWTTIDEKNLTLVDETTDTFWFAEWNEHAKKYYARCYAKDGTRPSLHSRIARHRWPEIFAGLTDPVTDHLNGDGLENVEANLEPKERGENSKRERRRDATLPPGKPGGGGATRIDYEVTEVGERWSNPVANDFKLLTQVWEGGQASIGATVHYIVSEWFQKGWTQTAVRKALITLGYTEKNGFPAEYPDYLIQRAIREMRGWMPPTE